MSKNGWRLPSVNSAICTLEFMDQVREGIIYAPKHTDVNNALQCYSIPTKEYLYDRLIEAFENQHAQGNLTPRRRTQIENLVSALKVRKADSSWYVALIGIFAPDHAMFTKSFTYQRKMKNPIEVDFDNQDKLFSDLPHLNEKQMRTSNRLRMPKEKSLELKLLKAQARMKELATYEQSLQQKLVDSKQGRFQFKIIPD